MFDLITSQATAAPAVAGSSRQEAVVLVLVLGYSEGPVGPEVFGWFDTNAGPRKMTIPASAVEVYTLWEEAYDEEYRW